MSWQFWKRKEKEDALLQMKSVQENLAATNEQIKNISDQVTKLTRLQFKSSKNTDEKLGDIASALTVQSERDALLSANQRYEQQQELIVKHMIHLLDDLDHVASGIKENDPVWHDLLKQWSSSIVASLQEIGICQLDVNGKTFNPEVSEALQTVSRDKLPVAPTVPYQVVDVLKRGFVNKNGRLVRKANVITVREDEANGEEDE